ncbi:MAG: site-specific integrase [Firmicutes bacterium]|nr:site-specific integrase [Bacillota bacterium]
MAKRETPGGEEKQKRRKRRASGEGTVRVRADGRWEAVIPVGRDPLTGKIQFKSFYGKSQKEAIEKRDQYLTEIRTGTYVEPDKTLFGTWVFRWLELFVKPKVRTSTYAKYHINARTHVLPALGQIELQKLTTEHIQEFYNKKAETHSSSVLAILHQIVNEALKQAVKQRLILYNPAENTVRPPVKYKEIPPLTEKELEKYLAEAKKDRLYTAFLLDLYTGLRKGELLALKWENIDLHAGILKVKESLGRVEIAPGKTALEFSDVKTEASKREIPLLPEIVQELKRHKARQNEEKLFFGQGYEDKGLVFASEEGRPIDPRTILKRQKAILKRAGLREEITIHTLRHTFATLLARAGVNPKELQLLIGHADIRTTLGTYYHPTLEDKKKAIEKLPKMGLGHSR